MSKDEREESTEITETKKKTKQIQKRAWEEENVT